MVTNICVLRSGGDFNPDHVIRLSNQVPDLVCLSDVEIEGIKTIPLKYNWPGWWSKMEMFRPDIKGDLFYVDLDTTVIKMPFMPGRTTVLTDLGDARYIGSGMMFLKDKDRERIWKEWIKDPVKHMAAHTKWPWGDQGFLLPFLKGSQRWQNLIKVYSYKIHCNRGIPADADVVCFHGKPRPWDIGL